MSRSGIVDDNIVDPRIDDISVPIHLGDNPCGHHVPLPPRGRLYCTVMCRSKISGATPSDCSLLLEDKKDLSSPGQDMASL
mmetsp:Transcript_48408/g.151793  ORF Transcript_48408/g.151793 Transcript_48408/m.151793 type:complete len:81 (-) Transcript_48408:343-585(-)